MNCKNDKKKRIGKSKRVSQACETCKKRKIRCNGSCPCLSCINSQTKCSYTHREGEVSHNFFNSFSGLGSDLYNAKHSLIKLANSSVPAQLRKSVSSLLAVLDDVQPQLYMTMDSKEIISYSGAKSVETELSGKHSLSKFTGGLLNTVVPVSLYFGIYSPLLLLTPMGLAWIIKNFISRSDEKRRRETVFLLLKYFDVGIANYQSSLYSSKVSPLRFYASSNGIDCDEEMALKYVLSEISNSGMKIENLLSSDNATNSFRDSVILMEELNAPLVRSRLDTSSIKEFFRKYDLILCLSSEFFQRSIFANIHDISIIKSSLALIEASYWQGDPFFFGMITGVACRRCLDAGLNRWEYYIGKLESDAEEERGIWWSCYWWDRWYAIISGKPPLIPTEMNCCLFPRDVMDLGVDETMDCLSLVNVVELNQAQPAACVSFGHIVLAKIVSKVFSAILYSRDFTDYRLSTKSHFVDLGGLVKKLKTKFLGIVEVFTRVQEKITPFLKANLEEPSLFQLHIQLQFIALCCFQAIESLVIRLLNISRDQQHAELKVYAVQSRELVFRASVNILISFSESKNDVHFVKCPSTIAAALLNVVAQLMNEPSSCTLYHLSLVCGVTASFNSLYGGESCLGDNFKGSTSWANTKHGVVLIFILTRICCQIYTNVHNVSHGHLLDDLKGYNTACYEIGKNVLDNEWFWYDYILGTKEQSDFTQTILRHINRNLNDFADNETGSKPETTSLPRENTFSDTHGTTLEDYLSSDVSLDFFNSFWGDITLDIYGDATVNLQK